MKNITHLLLLAAVVVLGWQCTGEPEGTTIRGTVTGAQNIQVFLDEVVIGKASNILAKEDVDAKGNFSFSFPEGLGEGIYNLRFGAKRINLVLDGSEKVIEVEGDLSTLQNYAVEVEGSKQTEILVDIMQGLIRRKYAAEDIAEFVDTVNNPLLGAYIAFRTLGTQGQFLDTQKEAQAKLASYRPDSEMTKQYANFIAAAEKQYMARKANERIQVGQPAPDIKLPNPKGKEMTLSDLKGNVVLLDFWASWCGPCRRENPNVVKVYNEYKDDGFTIFSVSLDGLDARTKARLGDQSKINQMMESSKKRWVGAIEKDGLSWPYHVSDLKKWDAAPASLYGVRSIPRTFLIDREGIIVATNLRGAEAIERELKKHI